MAQQITIDIVAETKKLTQGIDDANKQITGMSKGLKTATKAAVGFASAFVLKEGLQALNEGIEGFYEAEKGMKAATAQFGKGSAALKKVTEDAEKFGKELGIDNDEIIALATGLGARLPKDAKEASAELVLLAKNLEASSGGAIAAEATLGKLGKAFKDGEVGAKELKAIVPGLDEATYKLAETLSKAGKNQEAMTVLVEAGAKKFGGAAADQVTSAQRLQTALDDLKEQIAGNVVPIIEKLTGFLVKMIEAFDALPKPMQNVVLVLTAIVGIGGPLLGFFASLKTSLITLGLVSEGAALGTTALSTALKAIPIMAVIALIVLLIANWDDVSAAAKKTWEAVSKWFGNIYEDVKLFVNKAIDWVKDNWPLLLAIFTGPFGLFAAYLIKHKDEILKTLQDGWNAVKDKVLGIIEATIRGISGWWNTLRDYLAGLFQKGKDTIFSVLEDGWNIVKETIVTIVETIYAALQIVWLKIVVAIVEFIKTIVGAGVEKFNELKDKTLAAFEKLRTGASQIWEKIKDFITSAVDNIKDKFGEVYGKMVEVGKDIARGIGAGLTSMTGWFKGLLGDWIQRNIPDWAKTILKISSPSKVFAGIGSNIVQGLASGITSAPTISTPAKISPISSASTPFNITINAGAGTDPYALGRTVQSALTKYSRVSRSTGNYVVL
jgi:hypothetical protein